MAQLRMVLLSEYFHPENAGGTPTVVSHLARHLHDRYGDLELSVITSANLYRTAVEPPPREEVWEGIPITRLATPRSNDRPLPVRFAMGALFSLAVLRELLRRPSYDLVLVVTSPPALPLAAQAYRRLRGVPYAYLVHDLYPDIAVALGRLPARHPLTGLCRRVQRSWLREAAGVVVIGRCMKARLQTDYGVPEHRIEVIPNWADPDRIVPLPRDNGYRTRSALSGFVVLFAGSFGASVDFDSLLATAALVPEVTFAFVGNGEKEPALRTSVATRGLRNVRLLPRVDQDEVGEVLAAADASLVPLDPRLVGLGVPSKLHSVLASGRPAIGIVPSDSEVAWVLDEFQCGLVVPPGRPDALAGAIRRLRAEPSLALRMGVQARRTLEQHYTLDHAAAQFHALFRRITAPGATLPSSVALGPLPGSAPAAEAKK
jgi:glycosyltransferase involved in cell wall biosynthesis